MKNNPYKFGTEEYYKFDLERFKSTISQLDAVPWIVAGAAIVIFLGAIFNK